jgi:hypothetical protein
MSEERWASRDEFTEVEFVYVFNGQPREHHGDFVWKGEKCTVVCKVRASEWHANPSNPRIEPGECIELDPSSFVVTARAKPEERWWLTRDDRGRLSVWCGYVAPKLSHGADFYAMACECLYKGDGCAMAGAFDVSTKFGECLDITHKVKAARGAKE